MCFGGILLAEPLVSSRCLNKLSSFSSFQVLRVTLAINRFVSQVTGEGTTVRLYLVQRLAVTLDH